MSVHHCPCFNLGLAHRRVARVFEEALAPLHLTIAQAHCLSALYEQDARQAKDLARELGVDAGTLTPMLDRLERQGLVRRCPHPEDRRATRVCLTETGHALRREIESRCQGVNERLMRGFDPAEFQTFMVLIKRLLDEAQSLEGAGQSAHAGA